MWLYERKLVIVCNHPARFGRCRYCGSGVNFFFKLSHDLTWPFVQRSVWLNGWKFLLVSHHLTKFTGHRSCGSSDTLTKIFYVTLQGHMIKGSGDFIRGNSSFYRPSLPKLIVIAVVLMDIYLFYFVPWSYKATWLYGNLTSWVEITQDKSSSCQGLWPWALW